MIEKIIRFFRDPTIWIASGFAFVCTALGLVTEFYFVPGTTAYQVGAVIAAFCGIMAYVFGVVVYGLLAIDRKYPNAYPPVQLEILPTRQFGTVTSRPLAWRQVETWATTLPEWRR